MLPINKRFAGILLALVMALSIPPMVVLASDTASNSYPAAVSIDQSSDSNTCDSHGFSNNNGFCRNCDAYEPPVLNNGVYEIFNAGQLYWFAALVNSSDPYIDGKLMDNIVVNRNVLTDDGNLNGDGSGFRVWTPIGNLSNVGYTLALYGGTFEGNGKTVSGLYFNDIYGMTDGYAGLFGYINPRGTVQNVGVFDSYFRADYRVGGVAGYNAGIVTDCYNTGTAMGYHYIGGLVGENSLGKTKNCYNIGRVIILGQDYAGGVVGRNKDGTVINCYYDSTVFSGNAIGSETGSCTVTDVMGKTTEQFASGEVAYLLGDAFGQDIDNGKPVQSIPNFTGAKVYQGYENCDDVKDYSNDSAISRERPPRLVQAGRLVYRLRYHLRP